MSDSALNEKVSRLRQLMSEALPCPPKPTTAEAAALRGFKVYEFNQGAGPVLEQTPRARQLRDIDRIAAWYGWSNEIERALDRAGAASYGAMSDEDIDALHDRMKRLEQCVQEGLDSPDAPPAR